MFENEYFNAKKDVLYINIKCRKTIIEIMVIVTFVFGIFEYKQFNKKCYTSKTERLFSWFLHTLASVKGRSRSTRTLQMEDSD